MDIYNFTKWTRLISSIIPVILVLWHSTGLSAQNTVSGTVTDQNGTALIGVNVIVLESDKGTATDFDGYFELEEVQEHAVLLFSYIGYQPKEVPVDGSANIDVVMFPNSEMLDEIVVVGYGTQKKSDLTGAVTRADIESFRESPNVNIMQSLQGTVPGLNIGQVDAAGQAPSASIRGKVTISGNQSVLVVVDGVIYPGSLSDLNPDDVESIDILKDPSSKAIYGAQAANGVILVTTKKGKGGKTVINYNSTFTIQEPTSNLRYLNRDEYIQKAFDMDWQVAYEAPEYTMLKSNLDDIYREISVNSPYYTGYLEGYNYDWWGNLTNNGFINNHSLGISGSFDEKFNYYLSGGYTKQKGFILNDEFERFTFRANLNNSIFNWLKIGSQFFGSFSDFSGSSPSISQISSMSPLLIPSEEIFPNGITINPFLRTEADDYDKRNSIFGNFHIDLELPMIKNLKYRLNVGSIYSWRNRYYSSEYDAGLTGSAYKNNSNNPELTIDNIISYNKTFRDHTFDGTIVLGQRKVSYESSEARGEGFNDLSLSYNSLNLGNIQRIFSSAWEEKYLYQMARLNYIYNSKYYLTTTIRRDGFSGFSSDNKFGVFPSIGLGWKISDENFFDVDWLSNLKFRASYGENGNLSSRYSSLNRINISPSYVFGDGGTTVFGQESVRLPNDQLSWETTTGFNFGIDFSFFNNRISGVLDYYQTTTTDLLYNVSLPVITGYNNIFTNIGEIDNKGIEVLLNSYIVDNKNFSWNLDVNISSNKNKIVSLLGLDNNNDGIEDDLVESNLFIGQPLNSIYDYESAGIIQFGDEIPNGFLVGTHRIVDQNNDGVINTDDRTIIGYKDPAYKFGLLNEFTYKDFTLKLFINSVQGGKNGYLEEANTITKAVGDNMRRNNIFYGINYWTPSNPNARYRRLDAEPSYDYIYYGDRSFIRLQDITLSYSMNNLANKIGFEKLKLFINGKNIGTWTDWEGWDPETGSGLVPGGRPVLKGISIGIDIII